MTVVGQHNGQPVYGDQYGRHWIWNGSTWVQVFPQQQSNYGVAAPSVAPAGYNPGVLVEPPPPPPGSTAIMAQANTTDLAAKGYYRRSFYPTAPLYFNEAGKLTRYYSTGLLPTDPDYVVNSASPRTVRVDLPCILVAVNGGAFNTAAGNAFPVGLGPRDCWLVELRYGNNNEALTIAPRLANNVVGTAERPGEIGGDGWVIDGGAFLTVSITPLLPDLRVDVSLVMLEQRGSRSYNPPG